MFERAFQTIEEFIATRDASGAVALVGYKGKTAGPFAFGHLSFFQDPKPVPRDAIFDLASLSKVVSTTTITLRLMEDGLLKLDDRLGKLLPGVPAEKTPITVQQILSHTSGLPAVFPLYQDPEFKQKETALQTVLNVPMSYPIGTKVEYSCIGFITLGFILERLTNKTLDQLFKEIIADPLGLTDTGYNPPLEKLDRIAFTEWDPETKSFLRGDVHDENARALGGVSGNAGLFGTAADLGVFGQMLLQEGSFEGRHILKPATIDLFRNNYTGDTTEPRTLGWLLPSPEACSGSSFISAHSIGHTGFTGTSLWIDFEREFYGVLLNNRVHPTRLNTAHVGLRPRFYGAICQAIDGVR